MVDVIGRAKVIITGDVDGRSIDQAGGKIGSRLKVGAAVGAAALGTLAVAGVKAFKAFEEGEAVSAKLSTVLGNMGKQGAAEDLEKLATSLQRSTGFSDETIKSGQTLLATFSEVAESAGEAGGVFERASIASVDLAATGFGSVESASKALGKALQDPVKGVTMLSRAGVTFTEDQKKLIASFVEVNDIASAQAIVLAEVEKQVGGVGEASAKESVKISEAFGEIEESAGQALAALLGGKGGKNSLSGELFKVSDAISELAESKDWKIFGKNLRDTASDLGKVAKGIGTVITIGDSLQKKWGPWGKAIKSVLNPISVVVDAYGDLYDILKKVHEIVITGPDIPDAPDVSQPESTKAVGGPARGLTLVGERGPELLQLPAGSYVHNTPATKEIAASLGAGQGGNTTVFNITGPVSLAELRQRAAWYDTYGTRFG